MSNARNIADLPNGDDAPVYACRAWVNFDGTATFSPNPGTNAIRDSANVSSCQDNGTGDYTINFATAMPDANYVANVTSGVTGATWGLQELGPTYSSSQLQITLYTPAAASIDNSIVNVSVFR